MILKPVIAYTPFDAVQCAALNRSEWGISGDSRIDVLRIEPDYDYVKKPTPTSGDQMDIWERAMSGFNEARQKQSDEPKLGLR
jgi:hypothetical protein